MKEIRAFKCEFTGAIFEDADRAKRSEFHTMMKSVGGSIPHMGSVNSTQIMGWLADHIASEIYPSIADKLIKALAYYVENVRPTPRAATPQSEEDAA